MNSKCPISLSLTHYNRYTFIVDAIVRILGDDRISEIIISDDCSTDGSYEKLVQRFSNHPKVKLFRNEKNLDCYKNKFMAVSRASCAWTILFDSDNIMTPAYLDALWALPEWKENTIYCPEWAMPHFDYRAFSGKTFDRLNVRHFINSKSFLTALNTANYFINRARWMSVFDAKTNPNTSDSIYQNYNWMRAGGRLMIVPNLRYEHRVHVDSHFKKNWKKTPHLGRQIETMIRLLR